MIEKYVFGPFKHGVAPTMQRTDLEFYGLNQFRPSYVALIYFNDDSVDVENASEDRDSFAGSFALFGHQRCFGDEGHCEIHPHINRFDDRPSHPLTPGFKRVVVTDAMRRCLASDELTITVIVSTDPEAAIEGDGPLLDIQGMQISAFE
jgi:hypothetical protein